MSTDICSESSIWTIITAGSTFLAVIVASFTYRESMRSRKNSTFNALFSQLIANHKDVFSYKQLFAGFFNYYEQRMPDVLATPDCPMGGLQKHPL